MRRLASFKIKRYDSEMENFDSGSANKIEDSDSKKSSEIARVEENLTETLPLDEINEIFGPETFLIGGGVRDIIFGKNLINSDFDLMTRAPYEDVVVNLKSKGLKEDGGQKFGENTYSIKPGKHVVNLKLQGREIQAGLVGNQGIDKLMSEGDLTMNCCAFSISSKKILNPESLDDVISKRLVFCDPDKAKNDPTKIISAMKQISRVPDLTVPEETQVIIRNAIPSVIDYFANNPSKSHDLQSLFSNLNSKEVLDLFNGYDTRGILDTIHFKKPFLNVSAKYDSKPIDGLDDDMKDKITKLVTGIYGKHFDAAKLFNDKINSVAYEMSDNQLAACCLVDGERLYAVASRKANNIVALVHDLCRNNYNVWATISVNSERIIDLAVQASLKLVNNHQLIAKILMNNYPEYKDRILLEEINGRTAFTKKGSDDTPQVLLLS